MHYCNVLDTYSIKKPNPKQTLCFQSQAFFLDAFLHNNRVEHFTQLIGLHPEYLDLFLKTQHFIMRGDGPLPYAYRHYIAIMAAARHHCTYLIDLQKQEFLLQGGNASWLLSLENIPQKLKNLLEVNKILAHRPWLLNKSHIERLVKAKGKDNWSVSELAHAIVILAHFHSLCSFIYGAGIMPEVDQEKGHTFTSPRELHHPLNGATPTVGSTDRGEVEELVEKMQKIEKQHRQQQEPSMEELVSTFKKVESQCAELPAGQCRARPTLRAELHRFLEDPEFAYQDFAKRKEPTEIPTFRIQDYSWDDHGFSLANRLYNDVGTLLDQKFKTAYDLTYYTMGVKSNVDTSMFRRAIWNYIQCLYGIRHDDYDYKEVNDLIERSLKNHIKTVCCYPDRTTKKDYESVMRDFRHSEKIHVNLMLLEARMQAELLYALRAMMHYMT
ncbi:SESN1 [Cordylochernes scorpioides]|uniref:SESN1 n=1 Tax=Cordylochernes scorpioides TaxID=51811 RepID=A0ABY6JYR7_9ARAC|nr:SESN1 [Cordylochernes scorpioides]UYV61668.1 SESN1 [Cordylochernes scorpioides]